MAVIIFVAGATFAIGDGALRLAGNGGIVPGTGSLLGGGNGGRFWINYLVLGIALVAEGTSFARAYRQTRRQSDAAGYGLVEYVRISKEPTTKMVFSEDAVAVTGVLVACLGVALQQVTGDHRFNAGASVLIGLLLVYVAYALGRDIRGLLIGEAARPDQRDAIRRTIREFPEVDEVVKLLTMATGPNSILVADKIGLASGISSDRV